MTSEERRDIERWLAAKEKNTYARLIVDRWQSRERGCELINMAYWFQSSVGGKEHRINKVGNSIEEVALACMLQESNIRIGESRRDK